MRRTRDQCPLWVWLHVYVITSEMIMMQGIVYRLGIINQDLVRNVDTFKIVIYGIQTHPSISQFQFPGSGKSISG